MTHFSDLKEINKDQFFDNEYLLSIKKNIINGNIYVLRSAFNSSELKNIFRKIYNDKKEPTDNTKMVEGVGNIFYKSNFSGKGDYTTNDFSWYFFPWNSDQSGLSSLMQPYFNQVILMNEYDPQIIIKNTPKDKIIQRMQLIYYPLGRGHISLHKDPINITKVTCGVYITEFGSDYDEGGFYVFNNKKEKIYIDHKINSGDLILFYNGLFHGVDTVLKNNKSNNQVGDLLGRSFLNLSLIESHEVQNRQTTVGIKTID